MEYQLLDTAGNLLIQSITVGASEIRDAGSEIFDPAAAASVSTTGSMRRNQNSVVAFNFAELAAFNGLTTAAGYTFNSPLTADSEIYRIGFSVTAVPEPGTYALMAAGLLAVGFVARRRRAGGVQADLHGPPPSLKKALERRPAAQAGFHTMRTTGQFITTNTLGEAVKGET